MAGQDVAIHGQIFPNSLKWLGQHLGNCWLIAVPRWPTVKKVRFAVPIAKELFANKDPTETMVQSFTA